MDTMGCDDYDDEDDTMPRDYDDGFGDEDKLDVDLDDL